MFDSLYIPEYTGTVCLIPLPSMTGYGYRCGIMNNSNILFPFHSSYTGLALFTSSATMFSKVIMVGSPISPLSRLSYSVPPSVQILLRVKTVAYGFPASQAAVSNSRKWPREVSETSLQASPPVCLSNSFWISAGVVVNELTVSARFIETSGRRRVSSTRVPTLFHIVSPKP